VRSTRTAYDVAYVALAEALDVTLVTLDARIAPAAGHGAAVDLVV
jgi:predicted nucleic acid-binding protein